MFGFLSPAQRLPEWRRGYARVCQYQRKLFGLTSLPFLSYEAAFLYQLAIDAGLTKRLSEESPTCCRLRRLPRRELGDERVGSYAAAFGVVLAGIKLDDDVRDSGRWANRLLRWKYYKQVRRARELLTELAPGSVAAIESAVSAHLELERQGTHRLADYVKPTGDGFAEVFAGLVRDSGEDRISQFERVGRHVGQSIIAWDCAVDFESDRIRGEYTPLQSKAEVGRAFEFCQLQLASLGWSLPGGSVSRQLIASVMGKVRWRHEHSRPDVTRTLERWGCVREQGFTYARSDVCCEACLAYGCEAPCAGCAAGSDCPGCGCDGCCGSCRKAKPNREPNPLTQYFGRTGTVVDELAPNGVVEIDDIRIPARGESENIEVGATVRVVGTDEFGVCVTRIRRR